MIRNYPDLSQKSGQVGARFFSPEDFENDNKIRIAPPGNIDVDDNNNNNTVVIIMSCGEQ